MPQQQLSVLTLVCQALPLLHLSLPPTSHSQRRHIPPIVTPSLRLWDIADLILQETPSLPMTDTPGFLTRLCHLHRRLHVVLRILLHLLVPHALTLVLRFTIITHDLHLLRLLAIPVRHRIQAVIPRNDSVCIIPGTHNPDRIQPPNVLYLALRAG